LIVPLFSPQYSIYNLSELSFFFTNSIGAPAGEEDALINPLDRFSSIYWRRAWSSGFDKE